MPCTSVRMPLSMAASARCSSRMTSRDFMLMVFTPPKRAPCSDAQVLLDQFGAGADLVARTIENDIALDQDHRPVADAGDRTVVLVHDHGSDAGLADLLDDTPDLHRDQRRQALGG